MSFSESNFIVTVLDPGDAPDIVKGDIAYITSSQVEIKASTDAASGLTSGSVKLSLPADYFGSIPTGGTYPTLKLTATLEISKAKPNGRILNSKTRNRFTRRCYTRFQHNYALIYIKIREIL